MLFNASTVYAPGEPHGDLSASSGYQNVNVLGRYHLDQLKSPNLVIGLGLLLLVVYLLHRRAGRRR